MAVSRRTLSQTLSETFAESAIFDKVRDKVFDKGLEFRSFGTRSAKHREPVIVPDAYLNPRPLPTAVLERVFGQSAPGWDKVEAEAVALARRALVGTQPEEL